MAMEDPPFNLMIFQFQCPLAHWWWFSQTCDSRRESTLQHPTTSLGEVANRQELHILPALTHVQLRLERHGDQGTVKGHRGDLVQLILHELHDTRDQLKGCILEMRGNAGVFGAPLVELSCSMSVKEFAFHSLFSNSTGKQHKRIASEVLFPGTVEFQQFLRKSIQINLGHNMSGLQPAQQTKVVYKSTVFHYH